MLEEGCGCLFLMPTGIFERKKKDRFLAGFVPLTDTNCYINNFFALLQLNVQKNDGGFPGQFYNVQ